MMGLIVRIHFLSFYYQTLVQGQELGVNFTLGSYQKGVWVKAVQSLFDWRSTAVLEKVNDNRCFSVLKITRLFSIVAKPIKIVVVNVVFVKNKVRSKKIWLKKIHVEKTLGQ